MPEYKIQKVFSLRFHHSFSPIPRHCEHLTGFSGSTQKKNNLKNRHCEKVEDRRANFPPLDPCLLIKLFTPFNSKARTSRRPPAKSDNKNPTKKQNNYRNLYSHFKYIHEQLPNIDHMRSSYLPIRACWAPPKSPVPVLLNRQRAPTNDMNIPIPHPPPKSNPAEFRLLSLFYSNYAKRKKTLAGIR